VKLGRKKKLPCPLLAMVDLTDQLLDECAHLHI
jgi:hypothetical protein